LPLAGLAKCRRKSRQPLAEHGICFPSSSVTVGSGTLKAGAHRPASIIVHAENTTAGISAVVRVVEGQ
jgi:hypothetical protein